MKYVMTADVLGEVLKIFDERQKLAADILELLES
jgi:hypothetical protein